MLHRDFLVLIPSVIKRWRDFSDVTCYLILSSVVVKSNEGVILYSQKCFVSCRHRYLQEELEKLRKERLFCKKINFNQNKK